MLFKDVESVQCANCRKDATKIEKVEAEEDNNLMIYFFCRYCHRRFAIEFSGSKEKTLILKRGVQQ